MSPLIRDAFLEPALSLLATLDNYCRVEQRRARFRPTTSNVSALSSSVANNRQAMPTFPLPPLKFRTVGFPQYRLQASLWVVTFTWIPGLYAT